MSTGASVIEGRPQSALPRTISIVGNATLVAWLAYIMIAPTLGFQWIGSWHNEQRASQIALLLWTAAAYLFIGFESRRAGTANAWGFPVWLVVILAIGVLSSITTKFPHAALTEVGWFALLATTALLVAQVVSSDPESYARWACRFALLFCTAYVLGVATRYLAAYNLGRAIDLDVLILGYANPRFPSALLALLMPLVASTVVDRAEPTWLRSAAAVVLSFIWAINLGLGTRAVWFAYLFALPATVVLLGWRQIARLAVVVGLSAAAGAVLYFLLLKTGPVAAGFGSTVPSPTDNLSTLTSREILWQMSWAAIQAAPVLGIGPMQFASLDNAIGAHPHNWVLQLASEWGLVALVVLLAALMRWLFEISRAVRMTYSIAPPGALLALLVALAYGLLDGLLVMPVSQSAAVLAIGLTLGTIRGRPGLHSRTNSASRFLTVVLISCSIPVILGFSISSFEEQEQSTSYFRNRHPGAWLVPRFWEQGLLIPLNALDTDFESSDSK